MKFAQGETTQKMKIIGDTEETGTKIVFKPDPEIFTETLDFKFEILSKRLRELAFLNPGISIHVEDERDGRLKRSTTSSTTALQSMFFFSTRTRMLLHEEVLPF